LIFAPVPGSPPTPRFTRSMSPASYHPAATQTGAMIGARISQ
jgi:hypothetical protein